MSSWANGIAAATLVVEDVAAARRFYTEVFELPVHFEDDVSVVFRLGGTLVNLLHADATPELVAPAAVGAADAGVRAVYTIEVDDVDDVCARLAQHGVDLLNGPIDRPWGVRTASFVAPGGHVWELAAPST